MSPAAGEIIARLGMQAHPEGGWYVETFRDVALTDDRPASTAIYYLLEAGQQSAWHRVDAVETWHFHDGAPLALRRSPPEGGTAETLTLGRDLAAGERPQIVIPKLWWQAARSLGDWTLVGCTVAPGFRFEGFELAPPGWEPDPS